MKKTIRLAEPKIDKRVAEEVISTLLEGRMTQGKKVEKFEREFASFIGTKHAIAVSSGTAALHLALVALGIGKGDEVITTPFSFIASSNAIVYTGAKPVFIDIDRDTYNIDPKKIEEKVTKKTKAILPVHLYGLPSNMAEIKKIARRNKLFVVEDACQAHGSSINNRGVGGLGDIGCFSFYPTKNMFAGEGGMITTNSNKYAKKMKMLRNQGSEVQYLHEAVGYNYRMTEMGAIIGINQLRLLKKNNSKRISNARILTELLRKHSWIKTPYIPTGYKHVFHQYSIRVNKNIRKQLQEFLQKNGVENRIYYPIPIHKQKPYIQLFGNISLPMSETLSKEILSIPIHPGLTREDIVKVASVFDKFSQYVNKN